MGLWDEITGAASSVFGSSSDEATTPSPAPAPGITPPSPAPPGQDVAPAPSVAPAAPAPAAPAPAEPARPGGIPHDEAPEGFFQGIGDWGKGISQEGLGAVFDPSGAIDRQRAQRELAGMFNVVKPEDQVCTDGQPDPAAAQNTVTPEQFQQIARQYSDIRTDRTDIKFNTDGLTPEQAAAFKTDSMHDMASIMQTTGGRDLVGSLEHSKDDHTTTLSPLYNQDASGNYDPALGRTNTNGFAAVDGGNAANAYTTTGADGKTVDGSGTNSRIRYNPNNMIAPADADLSKDKWLPWRSDVLLYHEMVHSMDQTHGTMDPGVADTSGPNKGDGVPYDAGVNMSEHRAVGLGTYAGQPISEESYRTARRDIAANGVAGSARDGDATMPDRDTYFYHQQVAAPPGSPSGSPGTTRPADPNPEPGEQQHIPEQ